ncbi:MAG: transglycosylase SLT domain-containing protein [Alistipes sp.]
MKIFKNIIFPILFVAVTAAVSISLLHTVEVGQRENALADEASELLPKHACKISIYDNVFRRVGKDSGIDWRLMSAIAYHESRFREDAVSIRGAVGVMQIMPYVADKYGISKNELLDPICNIELSAKIIKGMERSLQLPKQIDANDRMAIMLACYNGGYAHISDACNLAEFYGEDKYSWDTVAEYLWLLSDADFYNHEVVNFGAFRGSDETIKYVDAVMSRYNYYCKKATLD